MKQDKEQLLQKCIQLYEANGKIWNNLIYFGGFLIKEFNKAKKVGGDCLVGRMQLNFNPLPNLVGFGQYYQQCSNQKQKL